MKSFPARLPSLATGDDHIREAFDLDSNPARTAVNLRFCATNLPANPAAGRVAAGQWKPTGRVEPQLNTYLKKRGRLEAHHLNPISIFSHLSAATHRTFIGGLELQGTAQVCQSALCFLCGDKNNQFLRFIQAAVESNCSRTAVSLHFLRPISPVGQIANLPSTGTDRRRRGRSPEHETWNLQAE